MVTRKLILALSLAGALSATPGPALAYQGDPIYNTRYYSDATYMVEVGFDQGNCTIYGAGYASHTGQATPYYQFELIGYCVNGNWEPI